MTTNAGRTLKVGAYIPIVETEMEGGIHRPEVMAEIEAFQRFMEQQEKVGGTLSIVEYMKAINRTFHQGRPSSTS